MDGRRTWFPAAQAKELGFADEVIAGRSKTSVAAFGRFFAHYKRVPEALRAVPAAAAPTPPNQRAGQAKRSNPKRTPMDRKTILAAMTGALASPRKTAQAMADSSDSELADAGRLLPSRWRPAGLFEGNAAAGAERRRRADEPHRSAARVRCRQDARRLRWPGRGKLDALHAKAQNGGLTAEAALDARMAIIRAEAVKAVKLTPRSATPTRPACASGHCSVEDYAAYVTALPALRA